MVYTHFEPRNTNGSPWTWVRKPLFRSLKSVSIPGSRTCSEANIMRGIEEYKDKKYIKVIFKVLTNGLHTFRTQKYEWIALDMGSKTSFPKRQIRN